MTKPRTHFSPSFLKNYRLCPYMAVNDKFEGNIFTEFGNLVHETLEILFTIKELTIVDAFEAARQEILNSTTLQANRFIPKLDCVEHNIMHNNKFGIYQGWKILDLESQSAPEEYRQLLRGSYCLISPCLPPAPGSDKPRYLRGKIDRLDHFKHKQFKIIDYKTGKSKNDPFQLNCYGMMVMDAYGLSLDEVEVTGHYWYLESGHDVSQQITPAALMDFYQDLCGLIEEYDSGLHMKRPSWDACRNCSLECPEGRRFKRRR